MSTKQFFYLLLVLFVAGASGITGAAVGGFAVLTAARRGQLEAAPAVVQAPPLAAQDAPGQSLTINTTEIETSVTLAVQRVGSAVVTVVGTVPGQTTFFGRSADQTVSGSGFFLTDTGYVLTNNHVVESSQSVSIILADGTEQSARIVGTDPYSDIAVLKADGPVPVVAALGNSDVLKPGETVIAIGSPLGDFKNTVTVGVVSATERAIDTGEGYRIEGLIQTDAAINQGNSGGPLLNLAGEVIGINTLIVRGSGAGAVAEGLGFAIPINTAQAVAQQIINQGYFSRPFLGINFQPITPNIAAAYDLPVKWGVFITDVAANGPAESAGLREEDIITSIGEVALDEEHSFINILYSFDPGDEVTIGYLREGKALETEVTLGESPHA